MKCLEMKRSEFVETVLMIMTVGGLEIPVKINKATFTAKEIGLQNQDIGLLRLVLKMQDNPDKSLTKHAVKEIKKLFNDMDTKTETDEGEPLTKSELEKLAKIFHDIKIEERPLSVFDERMPPEERAHRIVEGMCGWFERPLSEKHQLDEYMRRQHAMGIEEYKKELAVTLSQPQKIIHGFGHRFLFCPSKKVSDTETKVEK